MNKISQAENNNQSNHKKQLNKGSDKGDTSERREKYLHEIVDIRVSNVDKKIYPNKSLVKLCNYMDAYSNDYITNNISFAQGSADDYEIQKFGLKKDDVIITKDSETPDDIAVSAVVIEDLKNVVCGYHLAILRPNKNEIDGKYLMFYLKSEKLKSYFLAVAKGSTRFGLSIGEIEKAKIKLPSFSQQRHIARILSTADAVIEKTQAAIAKYKAIKQGMLHDLFTRGLRSEKVKMKSEKGEWIEKEVWKLRPRYEDAPELYKKSKLGWIPREWEVETIEKLTDKVGSGVTPTGGSEVYKTQGVLFLRSQNILNGELSLDDVAFIPNEIDEMMENSRVKPYDVLLNITGASIGRCAYFPEDLINGNVNQHVCIIRFKKASNALAVFASEYLNTDFGQRQMHKAMAVGNREGLNYQQIRAFNFPEIQNPKELEKIVSIIESLNNKLQTEQVYLQKMQSIKKGLMEDLLSGKVKVKS